MTSVSSPSTANRLTGGSSDVPDLMSTTSSLRSPSSLKSNGRGRGRGASSSVVRDRSNGRQPASASPNGKITSTQPRSSAPASPRIPQRTGGSRPSTPSSPARKAVNSTAPPRIPRPSAKKPPPLAQSQILEPIVQQETTTVSEPVATASAASSDVVVDSSPDPPIDSLSSPDPPAQLSSSPMFNGMPTSKSLSEIEHRARIGRPSTPPVRRSTSARLSSSPPLSPPLDRPLSMPLDLNRRLTPEPSPRSEQIEFEGRRLESPLAALLAEQGEQEGEESAQDIAQEAEYFNPYSSFSLLPAVGVDDVLERAMAAMPATPEASPKVQSPQLPDAPQSVAASALSRKFEELDDAEATPKLEDAELPEEESIEGYVIEETPAQPVAVPSPPRLLASEPVSRQPSPQPSVRSELSDVPPSRDISEDSERHHLTRSSFDFPAGASLADELAPFTDRWSAQDAEVARDADDHVRGSSGHIATGSSSGSKPVASTSNGGPSSALDLGRDDDADRESDDGDRPKPPIVAPSLTVSIFSRASAMAPLRHRLFAIMGSVAINLVLPFINGLMMGAGEIFAKEFLITVFGLGPGNVAPQRLSRTTTATVGVHAAPPRHALAKTAAEGVVEVASGAKHEL